MGDAVTERVFERANDRCGASSALLLHPWVAGNDVSIWARIVPNGFLGADSPGSETVRAQKPRGGAIEVPGQTTSRRLE